MLLIWLHLSLWLFYGVDGDYVLGWVWFGGTGTPVQSNQQQEPWPYGFFSDYWSCSFVRIQGGGAVQDNCRPTFDNDMTRFSREGCMAANDRPGVCKYEPCKTMGRYQKPHVFKNGNPPLLRSSYYGSGGDTGNKQNGNNNGGRGPRPQGPPPKKPARKPSSPGKRVRGKGACLCISSSRKCSWMFTKNSNGQCKVGRRSRRQRIGCKRQCCNYCKKRKGDRVCRSSNVRRFALWTC